MNEVKLSIKGKDYNGSHNKYFKSIVVDRESLKNISVSSNYSLITWKIDEKEKNNEYNMGRENATFESASGLVIDIDEDLMIYDAVEKLKKKNYNYIIITSRNHQKDTKKEGKFSPAQDRYHIILFFNREVTDPSEYSKVYSFFSRLFPNLDSKCKSLDRFLFASPEDAEYYSWFEGEDIVVDEIVDKEPDFFYFGFPRCFL